MDDGTVQYPLSRLLISAASIPLQASFCIRRGNDVLYPQSYSITRMLGFCRLLYSFVLESEKMGVSISTRNTL